MQKIQNITSDSLQSQTISLPDGTAFNMTMYFSPMQYGWFIKSFSYLNFSVDSIRITNNPNILRQFKNVIPFGLSCVSVADREPSLQQDFSSGASVLYILSEAEVRQYEEFLTK